MYELVDDLEAYETIFAHELGHMLVEIAFVVKEVS